MRISEKLGLANKLDQHTILLDLIAITSVIIISLILFRGHYQYGLEFDEVFRRNNLIPFFNADAQPYNQSIYNFPKTKIPLIYKNYISSVHLLPDLFWVGFDDYLYGLRFSYLFYFILGAITLYYGLKILSPSLALITTLLVVVNPILFPECRFGFANPYHFFLVSLLIWLITKYCQSSKRSPWMLLSISFFTFLLPNFVFYAWWPVAATIITSVLLYPRVVLRTLRLPKNILAIITGFTLGHINFVLYNIFSGFPSIKPLLKFIFKRSEYNQQPIDYAVSRGFTEDVLFKIDKYLLFSNIAPAILISLILMLVAIFLWYYCSNRTNAQLTQRNWVFFFPLITCLTFAMIMVSPNAYRSGHFLFLSPALEISLALAVLICLKSNRAISFLAIAVLACWLLICGHAANSAVNKANATRGESHFTPAFYQLNDYINEQKIKDQLIHLQWGFYAQLYFLNRGEIKTNSIVFHLIDHPSYQKAKEVFDVFFADPLITQLGNVIYTPIFPGWQEYILQYLQQYCSERSWKITIEKEFFETNGIPIFNLYRLERS